MTVFVRMLFFTLLLSLSLSSSFLVYGSALAQTAKIIMVTEHWPPFRMIDDEHPSGFRGIDIDLMEKLSEALGVEIEIQRHPWARALEMMKSGQADMITGIAYTPQREEFMHYVPLSYAAARPVFYTQRGRGKLIQSYTDLHGPSVGYSLYSAYFEPFNSDTQIQKVGLSNETQMLEVLALGRVDIIIGTDPNISYEVGRLGYRDILEPTAYSPEVDTKLFIALSRHSPVMGLAPQIEESLRRLMTEGAIEDILQAYR